MLASLRYKCNVNNERNQNYTLEDGAELDSFPVMQICTAIQQGDFFCPSSWAKKEPGPSQAAKWWHQGLNSTGGPYQAKLQ